VDGAEHDRSLSCGNGHGRMAAKPASVPGVKGSHPVGPGDARAASTQHPVWMGGHYRGVTVTSQGSAGGQLEEVCRSPSRLARAVRDGTVDVHRRAFMHRCAQDRRRSARFS
jgi:hypothetical protein